MQRALVLIALVVLIVISGVKTLPVYAQNTDQLQAQIDASNTRIKQIQAEIAALQRQLTTTTAEKQTLQKAINELNLSIQKIQKSISLTQAQIDKKDLEIDTLSDSIGDTAARISHSQEGVGAMLRELSAFDQEPMVLSLLSSGTLSSVFDEAANLSTLRIDLQNQIQDLSALRTDLEGDKNEAESKRKELASLSSQLGQQKQGLDAAKGTQNKLLQDTKSKEATYQAQIAQKQAEQAAFEKTLFDLASQLRSADPTNIPAAGSGVLRWPLDDIFITQQFGRTSDSGRLYSSGTHDGIDFRAAVGTSVRAARTGTIFEVNQGAVPLCQYGKWVLIKHDNGLATLYAHLSTINVKKGDVVAAGQVVGFSGNTGYATGPHLHFSVYVANSVAFKQYTCKSGSTLTIPIAPLNAYLNPLSYLPGF
ncbi:peptidoglycan DD-metalloendopeptidase family protein [Acetobacteraceae bacterium]|nr:peptidoglycan DD-metalloendopeptidase family protein [Candidatus Parcubacteria bacterium]